MSKVIESAIAALNDKNVSFEDGMAKFVIKGEGAIMVDVNGARAGNEEADVTVTADQEVFEGLLNGSVNPTAAFMMGKLSIEGNMTLAMKLGSALV
ncbi:MAG: SCP2 sterol-binding domain-containing protein [Paracoccus sp. (in: a-proteobacteria)]